MALFFVTIITICYSLFMSNKLYLDYNATTPLSSGVISYLKDINDSYVNPSSTYQSGVLAKGKIESSLTSIKNTFLGLNDHKLVFNSGASEGISSFFNLPKDAVMAYFESDHPAVHSISKLNHDRGHEIIKLPLKSDGTFEVEEVKKYLAKFSNNKIYINFTFVHNETGVVLDLKKIATLKKDLANLFVHVDCAQLVGKIENWNQLDPLIDVYSFSAHKFGGMKGVGFSFVANSFEYRPLIPGGGQQNGLRGGTINQVAIETTAIALKDLLSLSSLEQTLSLRKAIESTFKNIFSKDKGFIVCEESMRAVNTILLVFKKHKGDFAQIKFDMNGAEVSYGSACSSGSRKGSDTLRALNLEEYADNIIRISLGPQNDHDSDAILTKLEKTFRELS